MLSLRNSIGLSGGFAVHWVRCHSCDPIHQFGFSKGLRISNPLLISWLVPVILGSCRTGLHFRQRKQERRIAGQEHRLDIRCQFGDVLVSQQLGFILERLSD